METKLSSRLHREMKTIEAMVRIYCRYHHETTITPCTDCRELIAYAGKRLNLCPFQADKPTCGNCTVHCYKPKMREHIRRVMRYAGPRMIWHHPIMALRHLLDGRRPAPSLRQQQSAIPATGKNRKRNHS